MFLLGIAFYKKNVAILAKPCTRAKHAKEEYSFAALIRVWGLGFNV